MERVASRINTAKPRSIDPWNARRDFAAPRVASKGGTVFPRPGCAGFTLLELMFTLAVAAILLMIAIPSFINLILANRLATTTNDMVIAINTARMEAVKLNARAQFCANTTAANTNDTLGSACGTQTAAVYAIDGAGNITQVLAGTGGLVPPVLLSTPPGMVALRFDSQGIGSLPPGGAAPYTGTVAVVCATQLSTNNIYTINMTGGTILQVAKSTGSCPLTGNGP
jgi:type IV fimbrial biogenesis protein FimT